eukprot:gnl/Spiro4/5551_TR2818_c0_g1_i1.p1 gnl/Spiro4/5551_TR2818_c0_g1~~gnl/Spiro4/5551_TR2818_c0_g1_i1.p1  ORF type:complete len:550 (-),score=138.86 gnl/Spiro4/5551_TR2818_c0_g1_i1:73-1722(-)
MQLIQDSSDDERVLTHAEVQKLCSGPVFLTSWTTYRSERLTAAYDRFRREIWLLLIDTCLVHCLCIPKPGFPGEYDLLVETGPGNNTGQQVYFGIRVAKLLGMKNTFYVLTRDELVDYHTQYTNAVERCKEAAHAKRRIEDQHAGMVARETLTELRMKKKFERDRRRHKIVVKPKVSIEDSVRPQDAVDDILRQCKTLEEAFFTGWKNEVRVRMLEFNLRYLLATPVSEERDDDSPGHYGIDIIAYQKKPKEGFTPPPLSRLRTELETLINDNVVIPPPPPPRLDLNEFDTPPVSPRDEHEDSSTKTPLSLIDVNELEVMVIEDKLPIEKFYEVLDRAGSIHQLSQLYKFAIPTKPTIEQKFKDIVCQFKEAFDSLMERYFVESALSFFCDTSPLKCCLLLKMRHAAEDIHLDGFNRAMCDWILEEVEHTICYTQQSLQRAVSRGVFCRTEYAVIMRNLEPVHCQILILERFNIAQEMIRQVDMLEQDELDELVPAGATSSERLAIARARRAAQENAATSDSANNSKASSGAPPPSAGTTEKAPLLAKK